MTYERDDDRRLIIVTATDHPHPVTVDETLAVVDRQWAEGTWTYALLYDYRQTAHVTTPDEAVLLGGYVESISGGARRGPVALAVKSPDMVRRATLYSGLTARMQEFELLVTDEQIADWLSRHARPAAR